MSTNQEKTDLLDILLKPREDYFALENVRPLLPPLIEHVAKIGCKEWDKEALHELADELFTNNMLLASNATGGIKGIYGSHPMHGALLKIAECSAEEIYKRLYLLAHVIDVAYQWREDIQHAGPHNTFLPSDKKRLTYDTYLDNLETACKVVRKLDAEWLDYIAEGHENSVDLQRQLHRFSVDPEILDDSYIQQLERFLAYGLHSRGPRKGHSKGGGTAKKKAVSTQRQRPIDDTSNTAIDALQSSRLTVYQPSEDDDKIRQSGLSSNEEKPTAGLLQSNQFVASKKGDSSFQAAYRAHSQQQHQDKAAQLLPGRWEQLSDYDLYHLAHQLYDHPGIDKKLGCLVGLMLATGRDLETVLGAHVVRGVNQVPKKIDHQDLYVTRTADEWYAGILRPESARKINSQWQGSMRPTLDKLPLPISKVCQALIAPHARHAGINVKKRSQPLFKESTHQQLSDIFSQLLSTVNRRTGARLTEKRLSLHLFNTLNAGEADLAAACLITARMPTYGQQSPLYYYAPAMANLAQQYTAAMQRIEQPLSIAFDTDTRPTNAQPAIGPAVLQSYIGSQMVPTAHYVNELVAHMIEQQRAVKKQPGLFQQLTAFHNAYTAYTIAMLMFCTGYRSIRDPLPKLAHINFSRDVIVIADKTNDHQSNARFLPLPAIMLEHFKAYMKHRHAMLSRLEMYLGHDWETPFFLLDTYGRPQQVTPARLENHLQWPQSPPLNINRHYLHTQLKEHGCPAVLTDAFMGHWDMGQEPWAKYSTFCPREYRQRITSRVEDMMREQGWAVMEGIAL